MGLLTGEIPTNFLFVLLTIFGLPKNEHKWCLIRCVKWRREAINFFHTCLSVCTLGRNFIKLGTWIFFENLSGKFNFRVNLTRKTVLWHGDLRIFLINSRPFLIIKIFQRNTLGKSKHTFCGKTYVFRNSRRLRDKQKNIAAQFKVWGAAEKPTDQRL